MDFSRAKLISMIEACYDLRDIWADLQADERASEASAADKEAYARRKSAFEEQQRELTVYFQKLADALFQAGAFSSREEARRAITIEEDDRQPYLGPEGVVPDDGRLNPDEQADGILMLFEVKEFPFQAPIAKLVRDEGLDIAVSSGGVSARITSSFCKLDNLGGLREQAAEDWIWVAGTIEGRNYRKVRIQIEQFMVVLQGAMLALNMARYGGHVFRMPPPMTMGRGSTYNSGVYVNSIAARMAPQLIYLPHPVAHSELDVRRGAVAALERDARLLQRVVSSTQSGASEIRQALRMFLRAFESWSDGEKAMLLATTLEGLLLDKKNKDDLSARLQDSVAYLLGVTRDERSEIRRVVRDLYAARSAFVHTGELDPRGFTIEEAIDLCQRVLVKELAALA